MSVKRYDKMTPAQMQVLGDIANAAGLTSPAIEFLGQTKVFENSGSDDSSFLETLKSCLKGDVAINTSKSYPDQKVYRLDDDDSQQSIHWTDVSSSWKVVASGSLGSSTSGFWGYVVNLGIRYRRIASSWIVSKSMRSEWERMCGTTLLSALDSKPEHSLVGDQSSFLNLRFGAVFPVADLSITGTHMLSCEQVRVTSQGESFTITKKLEMFVDNADPDLWMLTSTKVGFTLHTSQSYQVTGSLKVGIYGPHSSTPSMSYTTSDGSIVQGVQVVWAYGIAPDLYWTVRIWFNDGSISGGDWWLDFSVAGTPAGTQSVVSSAVSIYRDQAFSGGDSGPLVAHSSGTWSTMEWDDDAWMESPNYTGKNMADIGFVTAPSTLCFWSARAGMVQLNDWPLVRDYEILGSKRFWYTPQSASLGGENPTGGSIYGVLAHCAVGSMYDGGVPPYLPGSRVSWPCLPSTRDRVSYEEIAWYASPNAIYSIDVHRPVANGTYVDNSADLDVDIGWVDANGDFTLILQVTIPAGEDRVTYPDKDGAGILSPLVVFEGNYYSDPDNGLYSLAWESSVQGVMVLPHWSAIGENCGMPHTWTTTPRTSGPTWWGNSAVVYHVHAWHYNLAEELLARL